MKVARLSILLTSLLLSAFVALVAQDLVYRVLVLPLSYVAWQLGILLRAVPQLVWWTAVVVIMVLVIGWQLVPDIRPAPRAGVRPPPPIGLVESVARWLRRARRSTYFRWQLAHRLSRISRQLMELGGRGPEPNSPNARVEAYFAAGMNHSFVDFHAARNVLARRKVTPLDVDAAEAVEYLESQSLTNQGSHADRL